MLEKQGGMCAICRKAPAGHVDHDHGTGAVRALLCFNCNGGLGQFKDDPVVLRAAADYIDEHQRRRQPQPLGRRRIEVAARPVRRPDGLRIWRVRHEDLLSLRSQAGLASLLHDA